MRLIPSLLVLSLPLVLPLAGQPAEGDISRLSWMTGCWSQLRPGGEIEEHWMAPKGRTMLGMSRTIRGGATVEHEFMRIRDEKGVLGYEARPSGQAPAVFPVKAIAVDAVTFENASHDFPQRIIYRRTAEGITARIEGTSNGKARGIDFAYVPCAR
jgi:hypothetical protein